MLGVINGTAPNPVQLSEMCDQLGNVMGKPSWLPVPNFALKAVLGEGSSVVGCFPYSFGSFFVSSLFHPKHIQSGYIFRFWRGKGCFLQKLRNWVSHSSILMLRLHLNPFFPKTTYMSDGSSNSLVSFSW